MLYSYSATLKTPRNNFHSILYQVEWKLSKMVHISTILGTNDFRAQAAVLFVFGDLKNPQNNFRFIL